MCGILGIVDPSEPVSVPLYRGGMALQHRGQDGAGIATFEKRYHYRTGKGLLSEVFRDEDLMSYRGRMGILHLRYATAGSGDQEELQPFLLSFPFGLALIHNGNLTNDPQLRAQLELSRRNVNSGSDSETLLHVFGEKLAREDLGHLTPEGVMRAVKATMHAIQGAYSVIVSIANQGIVAFRDPQGLRPLVLGKNARGTWALASESVALDAMEMDLVRDVNPGEAIYVTLGGEVTSEQLLDPRPAHCIFEYVYLARPESVIDRKSVSEVREELGRRLARNFRGEETPGVVFDVPSSAEDAAVSFAREAGIPYRKGIRRNHYSQRSFIAANSSMRRATVGLKFLFEKRTIEGAHVAVIDDSIVRGTTARSLVERLRQHGARKVSFFSASPPVRHPCVYGIDMAVKQDLIAGSRSDAGIGDFLGVDYLQYQSQEDLEESLGDLPVCAACFTGKYPTKLEKDQMAGIDQARSKVSGETGVEQ